MAAKTPKINVLDKLAAPKMITLLEQLPPPNMDDDGAGNVIYGYAPAGVAKDEAGWRIYKKSTTAGVTTILLAEGSYDFIHSWEDRATYTYSR